MKKILASDLVISADIGGTHISGAVVHITERKLIEGSFVRSELNSKSNAQDILNIWIKTLTSIQGRSPLKINKLAMAVPGPFDYLSGISFIKGFDKYESIHGLHVRTFCAEQLDIPLGNIKFRNNAEAMLAGQIIRGAATTDEHVIGVTLGTGFGSARHQNSKSNDVNWGNLPFKESIADNYLSARWFLKQYFERTGISLSDGVRELAAIANSNVTARLLFAEFGHNLGTFISKQITQSKPEKLLISGNISKAGRHFIPYIRKTLKLPIKVDLLGEETALMGAAELFERDT